MRSHWCCRDVPSKAVEKEVLKTSLAECTKIAPLSAVAAAIVNAPRKAARVFAGPKMHNVFAI